MKFKTTLLLPFFIFIPLNYAISQQEKTLVGVIRQYEYNMPMEGITLRISGTEKSAVTNNDGRFELSFPAYLASAKLNINGYYAPLDSRGIGLAIEAEISLPSDDFVVIRLKYSKKIDRNPEVIGSKDENIFSKQAIDGFTRIIESKEYNDYLHFFYNKRGFEYGKIERSENALSDYTAAIHIKPNYTIAFNNRALEYIKLGRSADAISDLTEVIRIDPKNTYAYYMRGYVNNSLGHLHEAISDFDRTIELDPKHIYAYHNRGYAYYKLGEWQKAIDDYDKQIAINGADYKPYFKYREDAESRLK